MDRQDGNDFFVFLCFVLLSIGGGFVSDLQTLKLMPQVVECKKIYNKTPTN